MPRQGQLLSTRYRSALVTGASSGLGAAIAASLLKEQVTVYGTTRNPQQEGLSPEVHWLAMDAANGDGIADWIRTNDRLLLNIDILINNCGSGVFGDIIHEDTLQADNTRQLLLGSPVMLIKAVLPQMRKRGGAIVNVSSLAAQFPLPYMAGYTAAKAGLSAFTQSLMLTEADSKVVLIDFQPGDFKTAFNRNVQRLNETDPQQSRTWERIEKLLERAPSPELGAYDLVKALGKGKSVIIRSGGFFQTRIAPLGIRFIPRGFLLGSIRRYYGIGAE